MNPKQIIFTWLDGLLQLILYLIRDPMWGFVSFDPIGDGCLFDLIIHWDTVKMCLQGE